MNFIEKIQNNNGEEVYRSKEIAEEFMKYYEALYAVRQKDQQGQGNIGKVEEF